MMSEYTRLVRRVRRGAASGRIWRSFTTSRRDTPGPTVGSVTTPVHLTKLPSLTVDPSFLRHSGSRDEGGGRVQGRAGRQED
jgi:hypothetical protein